MSQTQRQYQYDIQVINVIELVSVLVSEMGDGSVAYVVATKEYWTLDKVSGLAANGVNILAPTTGAPIAGNAGARWIRGATAIVGGFAGFFALMPGDNAATIAAGAAVLFPQDGPASANATIVRTSSSQFRLPNIGTYRIAWQVSVTEAGQLMLGLDSGSGVSELAPTVAGRATGTSQIVNEVYITTTAINSILTVRNPSGNAPALTITPSAGGTHAVSAWLIIEQVA